MQQLSQQNPSEFKAVAAQVATLFQSAASRASGSQAQFLTNLANQFAQSAQTGSLEASPGDPSAPSGQTAGGAQGAGSNAPHPHHPRDGGASMNRSSSVQQAFQSAMQILEQATGGTSSSSAPTST
jgi:hypothetical protein